MKFSLTTTLCFALFIAIAQAACDCAPSDTACLAACVTSANDCIQNCRDNSCYTHCIQTHWPTSVPSSALPATASSSAVASASSMASSSSASSSQSATATPTPNSASSSVPQSMIPLFIVFLILPLLYL